MNCARCDYLLWDLSENRCPECGLAFEVTDYSFPVGQVEFACRNCGHGHSGCGSHGHPPRRRFDCESCGALVDVTRMRVRPLNHEVIGQPIRFGTPWMDRRRGGFIRGFFDAVARLAISPGEYFRFASLARSDGALTFSVMCAYAAGAVVLGLWWLFVQGGLISWLPNFPSVGRPALILGAVLAIPFLQLTWNYGFGVLIQAVLVGLGHRNSELDASVRAVALGSAVLPAVVLMPPVGLPWYLAVVCSGVEHLHDTNRRCALLAVGLPVLLGINLGVLGWFLIA